MINTVRNPCYGSEICKTPSYNWEFHSFLCMDPQEIHFLTLALNGSNAFNPQPMRLDSILPICRYQSIHLPVTLNVAFR